MNTILSNVLRYFLIAIIICVACSCGGVSLGASGGSGGSGVSLGTGLPLIDQSSPIFLQYRDLLKSTVAKNVSWTGEKVKDPTVFTFRLDEMGQISRIRQRASSGNGAFDGAALAALQKSNPLPAPPEEVRKVFDNYRLEVASPTSISVDS